MTEAGYLRKRRRQPREAIEIFGVHDSSLSCFWVNWLVHKNLYDIIATTEGERIGKKKLRGEARSHCISSSRYK